MVIQDMNCVDFMDDIDNRLCQQQHRYKFGSFYNGTKTWKHNQF